MIVNINIIIYIKISIEISMLKYWRKKDFKNEQCSIKEHINYTKTIFYCQQKL